MQAYPSRGVARIAYDAVNALMAVTAGGKRLSLKSELPPLSLMRTTIAALCATPTHTQLSRLSVEPH